MVILCIVIGMILLVTLICSVMNLIATIKSNKKSSPEDDRNKFKLRQKLRRNIKYSYPREYERVKKPVKINLFDLDPITYEKHDLGHIVVEDVDTIYYRVTDPNDLAYGSIFKDLDGYQEKLWRAVKDKYYDDLY